MDELNKLIRLVSISVALVLLCGCARNIRDAGPLAPSACFSRDFGLFAYGTQFDAVSVDSKTSRFPTRYVIQSEDLTVNKEFPLERYKQRLYVMVVDAGRREFIPTTSWQRILGISSKRTFVAGYEHHPLSIDNSWRGNYPSKPQVDTFFRRSFQEIGFFDQVLVIPQDAFEKIILSGADKRSVADNERLLQLQLELANLKRRYEDGAIDNGEYVRKKQKNEDEQFKIAVTQSTPMFANLRGLHTVQEYYGDHLVAHIVVRKTSRTSVVVDLRILDPGTRNIVFHAQNYLAGWGSKDRPAFDQCVIYPLFNAFIDWVEKNSVSTGIGS